VGYALHSLTQGCLITPDPQMAKKYFAAPDNYAIIEKEAPVDRPESTLLHQFSVDSWSRQVRLGRMIAEFAQVVAPGLPAFVE
jgi:hypothetical protein